MLSIIICSISPKEVDIIRKNIRDTIGVDFKYELLVFDNRIEKLGITLVYNQSAFKSKYSNLLFIHEDVAFITTNWGEKLIQLLQNKKNGIIGLAGSTYLPSVPSGWYLHDEKYNNVYIRQGFKYKEAPIRFDNQGEDLTPVYLLDGVFLAMRKDVWLEFPFNESLMGFHAYDVDISQRVSAKYQNVFTKQIELLHKSEGKVDEAYFDAILHYKNAFFNYCYPKRDFKIELELLKQFYSYLRCYHDKDVCVSKIQKYCSFRILGIIGYFKFKTFLNNAK